MAEKRTTPNASGGPRRGKRAAPTIDLTATEVAQEPVDVSAPDVGQPETASAPPEPSFAAAPEPSEPPHQEPPVQETAPSDPPPPSRGSLLLPLLAGGAAGAGITILLLLALWQTGMMPSQTAVTSGPDNSAQIAALEKQIRELQSRPVPMADTKGADALNDRVGKIEAAVAKIPPGDSALTDRVAAADNALKSLGIALTALTKRNDDASADAAAARSRAEAAEKAVADLRASVQDVAKSAAAGAPAGDVSALERRMSDLEQSLKSARADIAKTAASDAGRRLALSVAMLRETVTSGAPFEAELTQVKTLGGNASALAPLGPFAASGVPTAAGLAEELRGIVPAMMKLSGAQAPSGGFFEKLEVNAGKLVRIRPVDAPPGNDASAVLARIEIAAAKADIAAALADLARLSDAARAPAQGWIAKARARQAALTAARQLAADAARSLGKP